MELTTDHSASSYGHPVLVDPKTKQAYGPADRVGSETAADWARRNLTDDPLLVKFLSSLPPAS